MKKIILLIAALLFLISCTSTNPYNLGESEGSRLKNREVFKGNTRYIYIFDNVTTSEERKILDPGIIADDVVEKRIFQIPSGELTLGFNIRYTPNYKPGFLYKNFQDIYEIMVINPTVRVEGLEGVKINALEGYTYQINCKIEDGKAYIWIEDESGKKVSETVRGIGATRIPGTFSYNYWLWENLPDPVD